MSRKKITGAHDIYHLLAYDKFTLYITPETYSKKESMVIENVLICFLNMHVTGFNVRYNS